MLTQLDIRLFKCFELLQLPLAPLTLLSGGNASGKSSVLQTLVLLHQTIRQHEWSTRLMLNGSSIKLGTVTDIVDSVNGSGEFGVSLTEGNHTYAWSFAGERSDMSMAVDTVTVDGIQVSQPNALQYLLPINTPGSLCHRLRDLAYITAERVGPREIYPLEDQQIATVVGPSGEFAASVLHQGRDERVLKGLVLPEVPATRLRQVEERMRTFFPGCGIALQQVLRTNAVTLGFRTSNDTDFHRPINVGFGLTQVFPIIVAALSAHEGSIILIENPEVHLHPAGQALMGQFLAEIALVGVQIIVETHSDHILNGIRRSVRANKIEADKVAIHFFRPRTAGETQVISPQLDHNGNIDTWPDGFFDQFDKDSNDFAGWGV